VTGSGCGCGSVSWPEAFTSVSVLLAALSRRRRR
jgi:uncharacterized protein (TIGR03382 family)